MHVETKDCVVYQKITKTVYSFVSSFVSLKFWCRVAALKALDRHKSGMREEEFRKQVMSQVLASERCICD